MYELRRERLTHVCIASSVTTIGLGSFGIYGLASFKRAAKKKCLCRINLFCLYFVFFLSQKKQQTIKKREQIKCGGDVPKTILESGVVVLLICSL